MLFSYLAILFETVRIVNDAKSAPNTDYVF